ncbi:MAG: TIGR03085 family metal-binding protein [Trebonia sp.]
MTYSLDERLALAALLAQAGPDAPTLCAGWQTRDLAAHVVLRERRPDAGAGMIGGPLAGYTARVQRKYLDRYSYPQLIELFSGGPPRLSPFAIPGLDETVNTVEYFVHHEDVRRAARGWTERELPAGLCDALWKRLKGSRLFLRSAPTGIVFARADASVPPVIAKNAAPSVTVTGSPAELTLWSMGRAAAAHVQLDGPGEAVARLTAWRQ